MDDSLKQPGTDADREPPPPVSDKELEAMYKKVGITAVFAAANYVKQSKPRRAA